MATVRQPVPTSGTTGFAPSAGELILYSFSQAGVMRSEIEEEHLVNARMAANMVLVDWSGDQPHLWDVDLLSIPLVQGIGTYQLPGNTILALDVYRRTYQLPNVSNQAPAFITTLGGTSVTVGLTNHGLSPAQWVNITAPVAIGGTILWGYYQVTAVPNGNQFTITASTAATSAAGPGGVLPLFTTVALSATVTVTLPAHGLLSGFTWNIPIQTAVGGTTLSGAYIVQTVIDPNNFTISAAQTPTSSASAYENAGFAQYAAQSTTVMPTNQIMWPVGRSEFAAYAVPTFQAPPTTFWFDRTTPDGAGPYTLEVYRVRQIQDVNVTFAQSVEVPYRFLAAFSAGLAEHLAVIYHPERLEMLEKRHDKMYGKALIQDTEKVPIYITPLIRNYWSR